MYKLQSLPYFKQCMCNNTNIYTLNKILKQINDPSTLSFLFVFRKKKYQTNPKNSFIRVFVSLTYFFVNRAQKKNVYSVNKTWQKEHSKLTNVYLKNYNTFQECPIDFFSRFYNFSLDFELKTKQFYPFHARVTLPSSAVMRLLNKP